MNRTSKNKKTPVSNNTKNGVNFGDGILDTAKSSINDRSQKVVSQLIDLIFNYIEEKVNGLPDAIKNLHNNPETEKEVISLWSQQLYEQGKICKGYNGLSDDLLIHNFRQEGYLDGMYVGFLYALIFLLEKKCSKEMISEAEKIIGSQILSKDYEDCHELVQELRLKRKKLMQELNDDNTEN